MASSAGLHPDLIDKIEKVLSAMAAIGFPMRICQSVRTASEQHELWRKGRDLPGPKVTNCDGYTRKSNHQITADGFGHAVDCCFTVGEPFGEGQPWSAYGTLGEAVGLAWGGRWTNPVDRPHLELKPLTLL